jgi:hypothetical protein
MKTVPDGDEVGHTLGKKVEQAPEPVSEWEKFKGAHGDTLWRNKVTGHIQTNNPYWQALNAALYAKDRDGFCVNYEGSW